MTLLKQTLQAATWGTHVGRILTFFWLVSEALDLPAAAVTTPLHSQNRWGRKNPPLPS